MVQNDAATVLKRGGDLMMPAILAATGLLAAFTAFSVAVLAFEIAALFKH
ncbi:hypothetical protein [Methylobacterium durans]|nr:hypothetical protein [Methylobacterium durans]